MAKIVSGLKYKDLEGLHFIIIKTDHEGMLIQDISRGYSGIAGSGLLLIQAVPTADRADLVVYELAQREIK